MSADTKVLSQEEIDALMSSGASLMDGLVIRHNGQRVSKEEKVQVFSYNPTDPVFLTGLLLERFKGYVARFIEAVTQRFAVFFKLDIRFKLEDIRTLSYKFTIETLLTPTFIGVFKMAPLKGMALLSFPAKMAMGLVERMLGGVGILPAEGRPLTTIEGALAEDILKMIMEEWASVWQDVMAITPGLVSTEHFPAFLKTAPPQSIMLILTVTMVLGDANEVLHVAIPYTLLEPMLKTLEANAISGAEPEKAITHDRGEIERCADLKVPVEAWWEGTTLFVDDLLRLRVGDVIEFPQTLLHEVEVRIGAQKAFIGSIGTQDDQVAVEIN
jgi:flagellar motor switch protein FliM